MRGRLLGVPAPGRLSKNEVRALCIVGFVSHMILQPFLFWQFSLIELVGFSYGSVDLRSVTTIANNIAFPLAIIALGVSYRFWGSRPALSAKSLVIIMLVCFLLGMGLAVFAPFMTFASDSVIVATFGTFIGVGCAVGIFLWQQVLFCQGTSGAIMIQVSGTAIAGVLYFAVRWLPNPLVLLSSAFVFLPVSAGLLLYLRPLYEDRPTPRFLKKSVKRLSAFLKRNAGALLSIVFMGYAWGLFYEFAAIVSGGPFLSDLFSFGRIVTGALLGAYALRFRSYPSMGLFVKVALPVCITAVVLMPLIDQAHFFFLAGVFYVVFGLSSVVLMLSCNDAARSYSMHPALVYCSVLGLFYLMQVLGYLTGPVVWPDASDILGTTERLVIALVIVYGLSVLGLLFAFSMSKRKEQVVKQEDAPFKKYAFTDREVEVVRLLLKGRDVAHIGKMLVLSENTVRFHMKNIYAKAGVHSKQELLDLFD